MLKRTPPLVLLLAITLTAASCIFDPAPGDKPKVETRVFLDRTQKWHVLNNIELSYNTRKISYYDALLDPNFTFFLSTGDVGGGLPESWGREVEVQANTNLFSKEPPDGLPRCKSIKMDIQWETDPTSKNPQPSDQLVTWVQRINGDEVWWSTTLFYDFQIDVEPDMTYINNPGSSAEFTVRQGSDGKWTLVEFHDKGTE